MGGWVAVEEAAGSCWWLASRRAGWEPYVSVAVSRQMVSLVPCPPSPMPAMLPRFAARCFPPCRLPSHPQLPPPLPCPAQGARAGAAAGGARGARVQEEQADAGPRPRHLREDCAGHGQGERRVLWGGGWGVGGGGGG